MITEGAFQGDARLTRRTRVPRDHRLRNWRAKGEPLPEWRAFKWKGRKVEIVPDTNSQSNRDVRRAFLGFADYLASLGAIVSIRLLYDVKGDGKANTGLDDFLTARGLDAYQGTPLYALDDELIQKYRQELTGDAALPPIELTNIARDWLDEEPPPLE